MIQAGQITLLRLTIPDSLRLLGRVLKKVDEGPFDHAQGRLRQAHKVSVSPIPLMVSPSTLLRTGPSTPLRTGLSNREVWKIVFQHPLSEWMVKV